MFLLVCFPSYILTSLSLILSPFFPVRSFFFFPRYLIPRPHLACMWPFLSDIFYSHDPFFHDVIYFCRSFNNVKNFEFISKIFLFHFFSHPDAYKKGSHSVQLRGQSGQEREELSINSQRQYIQNINLILNKQKSGSIRQIKLLI